MKACRVPLIPEFPCPSRRPDPASALGGPAFRRTRRSARTPGSLAAARGEGCHDQSGASFEPDSESLRQKERCAVTQEGGEDAREGGTEGRREQAGVFIYKTGSPLQIKLAPNGHHEQYCPKLSPTEVSAA